jgi:hypothetical protein
VLREITALCGAGDLLAVTRRDERTMRTFFAPGAGGERLLSALHSADTLPVPPAG